MASALLNRMILAFRAGFQFHGRRNLYEVFGYPRTLLAADLLAKYQRQDIVSRIVNMPPEEMWSLKPSFESPDGLQSQWDDIATRFNLWDRIIQADKLCCFGPFSVLFLGLPGADLSKPAPYNCLSNGLDNLYYIQAHGAADVMVETWEQDTTNPRYGQPVTYQVRVGPEVSARSIFVHWTRIVHIVDRPLKGLIFGEPRLVQVFNILEDLLKLAGGSAELFWITANRGMQVDVDKEMDLGKEDAAALTDELEEFHHGLRRYIRTRGVTVKNLGSDVADPRGSFEVTISLLSGATHIPQRILMGAEAGQLASEQDRANWAEYIERRRTSFGVPYILKPILQRFGDLGYFAKDDWLKAEFDWPEAFHMNPVERANSQASFARSVVNLSRRNQFGNPLISDEEARKSLGLEPVPTSGETMPAAPPKPTGPSASPEGKGSQSSVTDAPSAISEAAATIVDSVNRSIAAAESVAGRTNPMIVAAVNRMGERVNEMSIRPIELRATLEMPEGAITVRNDVRVEPAAVHAPIQVAPAAVTTGDVHVHNAVESPAVHIQNAVEQPAVHVENHVAAAAAPEVKMGDIHVNAELRPSEAKPASTSKVIVGQRMPDGSMRAVVTEQPSNIDTSKG